MWQNFKFDVIITNMKKVKEEFKGEIYVRESKTIYCKNKRENENN